MVEPSGSTYPFEIRTRSKINNFWESALYRPFRDYQNLLDFINKDITVNYQLYRLKDNHNKIIFNNSNYIHELGNINPFFVKYALNNFTFRESLGHPWYKQSYSPTTKIPFHIVPVNYDGAFIQDCNSCHSTTLKSANSFDSRKEWYGYVKGSDTIFSWHPVKRSSISFNGFYVKPKFLKATYLKEM